MEAVYQPVDGVAEVRMEYILNGESCENVFHVSNGTSDPWELVAMEDLASTFIDWETASAAPARTAQCALHNVTVTDLTSLTGFRLTSPVVPPIAGTIGGDAQSNNVTFALKADVHNRGRGQNGRTFWVGLAEGQTVGSTITSTARDAIVSALNALLADITALHAGYQAVVVHREIAHIRPPVATFSRVFLYSATDDTLDSQKNRLPNHRRRHHRALAP